MKENYGTLSETLNGLIKLGYTHDFNIFEECLVCHQNNIKLSPQEFQIDKVYRFEGASDPEDESILYAISSPNYNIKGTLVNGYGISNDEKSAKLIEMLQTHLEVENKEEKSNEATTLRPDGNRIIDAEMVKMDLHKSITQLKSETTWAENDKNSVTLLKSDTIRIVLIGLHKNAVLKPHKAIGAISVQVIEGTIDFITENQNIILEKGQMVSLQPNISHSVVAHSESFILLTLVVENL